MNLTPERIGWLIVGHGTRHTEGLREFHQLAKQLIAGSRVPAEACYLELAEPTIEQGLAKLVAVGVREIIVVPVLLFSAGHAKQDVPAAVQDAAVKHGVQILAQTAALECTPHILERSKQLTIAALADPSPDDTQILLVARGSSDPIAIEQANEYGRRLGAALNLSATVAFVAKACPSLSAALHNLAQCSARTVIVVPHLLFCGEVLETIERSYEIIREQQPQIDWRLAAHLGPHPLVAMAFLDCIDEAGKRI